MTSSEGGASISACVCRPGAYRLSKHHADGCAPCPWGQYSDGIARGSCIPCPAGTYDALYPSPEEHLGRSSMDACAPCPSGSSSSSGSITCACNAGYWMGLTGDGSLRCAPCGPGRFSLHNFTTCNDCPLGHFSALTTASVCIRCPRTFVTPRPGADSRDKCVCPCGTYRTAESRQCIECPVGTFGLGGNTPCAPCPTAVKTGQCKCMKMARRSQKCICSVTHYSVGSLCLPCPPNSQAINGLSCTCVSGFYTSGSLCLPCPLGRFGRILSNGTFICDPCGANTYNPYYGQSSCNPCPDTSTVPAGVNINVSVCKCGGTTPVPSSNRCSAETTPTPDEPGVGGVSGGGVVYIEACPAGQEPDPAKDKKACRACLAGTYKYLNSGKNTNGCVCCPEGKYSSVVGASMCSSCPANSSVSAGGCGGLSLSNCLCNVGFYNGGGSSVMCTPCHPGTSSGFPGATGKFLIHP
jgi:hypothetical protein